MLHSTLAPYAALQSQTCNEVIYSRAALHDSTSTLRPCLRLSQASLVCAQGALDRGVLHASDVKQWLQLMSTPIVGQLCKLAPAFRDRMLGNPRFLMVLAIEEAIGVAAKWSAEVRSRGDRFKKVRHPYHIAWSSTTSSSLQNLHMNCICSTASASQTPSAQNEH